MHNDLGFFIAHIVQPLCAIATLKLAILRVKVCVNAIVVIVIKRITAFVLAIVCLVFVLRRW